jgi:hypothetical protein
MLDYFWRSPIRSPRNWRFMTSRRKSRRLSCCHHVRLSGEGLQSFGDSFSPGTSRHLKHVSNSNLKTLDVRDDETPWAKPRLRLAGWVRFISGVSSWGKPSGLTETLTPWVAGFIGLLHRWRRAMVERWVLRDENGFESSWGFAAEPFTSNFEQLKTLFYFGIRKVWFRIPQHDYLSYPTLVGHIHLNN